MCCTSSDLGGTYNIHQTWWGPTNSSGGEGLVWVHDWQCCWGNQVCWARRCQAIRQAQQFSPQLLSKTSCDKCQWTKKKAFMLEHEFKNLRKSSELPAIFPVMPICPPPPPSSSCSIRACTSLSSMLKSRLSWRWCPSILGVASDLLLLPGPLLVKEGPVVDHALWWSTGQVTVTSICRHPHSHHGSMSPVARIPHHPALAQSHSFALFSPPPQVEGLDRVRCKDAHRLGRLWSGFLCRSSLALWN